MLPTEKGVEKAKKMLNLQINGERPKDVLDEHDANKAAAISEADKKYRAEQASKEIQDILKKWNCSLTPIVTICGDGRIIPSLDISGLAETNGK